MIRQASRPARGAERRLAGAEEALSRAQAALARYRDSSGALTALTPQNFAAGLAKRQGDVEGAAIALAIARTAIDPTPPPPDLETAWPQLSVGQRRAIIERTLDGVFLAPGREPASARARALPRGSAPADLPRRGVPLTAVEPFDPAAHRGSLRLRAPARRSPRRIEAELRAWRADQSAWPSYVEFLLAGRARLYLQVLGYGGPHYWARRLGCSRPPRVTNWSEQRIRDGLRPILAGREQWPSRAEFEALGLSGLRRAVIRNGGIASWARELGSAPEPTLPRIRGTAGPPSRQPQPARVLAWLSARRELVSARRIAAAPPRGLRPRSPAPAGRAP